MCLAKQKVYPVLAGLAVASATASWAGTTVDWKGGSGKWEDATSWGGTLPSRTADARINGTRSKTLREVLHNRPNGRGRIAVKLTRTTMNRHRRSTILVAVLSTLVAGCAGPKPRAFYLPPLKLGSSIDTADGVDHREAGLIAGIYMARYVNLCGMPDDPVLEKGIWVSKLWVGYIPCYWGKLCISRETGNVVCEPRPNRVADFQMRMDRHGIVFTEAGQPLNCLTAN